MPFASYSNPKQSADDLTSTSTSSSNTNLNEANQRFYAPFSKREDEHDGLFVKRKKKWETEKVREKIVMKQKSYEELLGEDHQIQQGPNFCRDFGTSSETPVSISGGSLEIPPIQTFGEFEFSPQILSNMNKLNYEHPIPIQRYIIPIIMETHSDILAVAPTGSGKTASFLIPIIDLLQQQFQKRGNKPNGDSPYAIILAPTKELVIQLRNDARLLAEKTGVKIALSVGDMQWGASMEELKQGCDILFSSMGRIHQYVKERIIKLDRVQFLVLDEMDKLLTDDQVKIIELIKEGLNLAFNENHRTLMYSATIDNRAQEYADKYLTPEYYRVYVGHSNQAVKTIKQRFIKDTTFNKKYALIEMLKKESRVVLESDVDGDTVHKFKIDRSTIILVNERRRADWLAITLAQEDFRVMSICSQRTMSQRVAAVEAFAKGHFDILVGTDVIGRGLNFPKVEHVINFDLPHPNEQHFYIHRIGRTGRLGNEGDATTFIDVDNGSDFQLVHFLIDQLQSVGQSVPGWMEEIVQSLMIYEQDANVDAEGANRRPSFVDMSDGEGAWGPDPGNYHEGNRI